MYKCDDDYEERVLEYFVKQLCRLHPETECVALDLEKDGLNIGIFVTVFEEIDCDDDDDEYEVCYICRKELERKGLMIV